MCKKLFYENDNDNKNDKDKKDNKNNKDDKDVKAINDNIDKNKFVSYVINN